MNISESSPSKQLIDIYAIAAKTSNEIGVAILQKQKQVSTQQGDAILKLLESAVPSAPSRLDVKA